MSPGGAKLCKGFEPAGINPVEWKCAIAYRYGLGLDEVLWSSDYPWGDEALRPELIPYRWNPDTTKRRWRHIVATFTSHPDFIYTTETNVYRTVVLWTDQYAAGEDPEKPSSGVISGLGNILKPTPGEWTSRAITETGENITVTAHAEWVEDGVTYTTDVVVEFTNVVEPLSNTVARARALYIAAPPLTTTTGAALYVSDSSGNPEARGGLGGPILQSLGHGAPWQAGMNGYVGSEWNGWDNADAIYFYGVVYSVNAGEWYVQTQGYDIHNTVTEDVNVTKSAFNGRFILEDLTPFTEAGAILGAP
jgi:hypothetical protein